MDMQKWTELIKLSSQYQDLDFWKEFCAPESSDLSKKRFIPSLEQEKINAFLSTKEVYPRCDMYEAGGRIIIEAEVPGLEKDDIKVSLIHHDLVIKGKCSSFQNHFRYFLKERPSRTFEKKLTIPLPIDKNSIETSFTHGILSIILPIRDNGDEKVPIYMKKNDGTS
ncbi:Hsp20/alpha crystallin family protein [Bacillus sp. ISL-47]|uniref:Hsp20/alpha crystallin family protein n=1 Tax=Bacillus sp. ISL-47 TaxID=2819130 RepID=UPI001BE6C9C4|nr:Hsp20/alpha crystallin family protein [Bacillus sp. ISL-47]MBT2691051.1 Hsp20/alpha crystallin family protein [Bacillus sp. ISL-47]MBT2710854.1 Hsp20/alpha crystallin family protein [Pseudomonas sp. ISL-84]